MGSCASLLLAVLLAADPPGVEGGLGDAAEQPKGGASVSPVELIPKLELRQSFVRLATGVSVHDTTPEIDIQFLGRVLLRYEGLLRVVGTPAGGQVSGLGDVKLQAITVVSATRTAVVVVIVGGVLDTASQPALGAGKQQLLFGGAAGLTPRRWWLAYAIAQEQLSVGGAAARPDINRLVVRLGNVLFDRGFGWYKADLDVVGDFEAGAARLFGTLEVGRLLIGRVGLFSRAGTQLLGSREVDYSLEVGVRYLFRLGTSGGR